ncbi:MAG: shikimate kinase [Candidatus Methanomethylicia archaeon]|nr:shikimate kinase [Candidatus Methanomethylicia archaeon]
MRGKGLAFGAATVVNAMPSGYGAALGVNLKTEAEVELVDGPEIEVEIKGDARESGTLAAEAFKITLERFGIRKGGRIKTESEIPIAVGMKSSSAAANAVMLATLDALGKKLGDLEVIKMGVEASIRAGVTVTGAFDDACASYLGGLHVTDNYGRRILKSIEVEPLSAVFLVPEGKRYSGQVDAQRLKAYARPSLLALDDALNGRHWQAMLLNGMVMARAFDADPMPMLMALKNGAISAGFCGKGPAVCAIVSMESEGEVVDGWRGLGWRIIRSRTNSSSARQGW